MALKDRGSLIGDHLQHCISNAFGVMGTDHADQPFCNVISCASNAQSSMRFRGKSDACFTLCSFN